MSRLSVPICPWLLALGAVLVAASGAAVAQSQVQLPELTITAPALPKRPKATAPAARKAVQPKTVEPEAAAQPAQTPQPFEGLAGLTTLPGTEITAAGGANLADQLQFKPGLAASTFAAGASRPVIRGLDESRISVRENGIGSHDVSGLSEDHAVPIDPYAADKVEIVRGPAAIRYGGSAIGGLVNATNQRIPDALPRDGLSYEIRGGGTSVDNGTDGGFKVTTGAGNVVAHADSFFRRAGDYATPQGRQFNSFVDSYGYSTGLSLIGHEGFAGIAYTQFNSLYGIPGADALTNRTRIDMHQDKIQSRAEWRVRDAGIESIRLWLGGSAYAHNEIDLGGGVPSVGARFSNHELEGRMEIQHLPVGTPLGVLRGMVGVQAGHRETIGASFEGDSLLAPATTRTTAAFVFEELQMTRHLRLQAGGRIEQVRVAGIGLDISDASNPLDVAAERTFLPVSGSVGLLYQLPENVVARLTGHYTQRAPEASELFSRGAHDATSTFELGNPYLDKEVAKSIEIGLKRSTGAFRFDAAGYATWFDGFIYRQRTGETCDVTLASCSPSGTGGDLSQVLFQQRNAVFYGTELSAQQDIGRAWRGIWGLDGRYDFVQAQFTDAIGGNVPRIAPHRLGAGLYYRDGNWHTRAGILHAFDQTRIGENETPTKGYTLLDAAMSYTWKTGLDRFAPEATIGLRGDNLLNEDVRNHVSFQKDFVLQPGRSVRLYGSLKLN